MSKINIDLISDEVVNDVIGTDDMAKYLASVEAEIDAICHTVGETLPADIPVDVNGFYISPILQVASRYKLVLSVLRGYSYSSNGNDDAYAMKIELATADDKMWTQKINRKSIMMDTETNENSHSVIKTIVVGG